MRGPTTALRRVALTLVCTGALLLSFVAYQLWGTALYEHSAQAHLRQELAGKLHSPTSTTSPSPTTPGTTPATPATVVNRIAPTTADPSVGSPIGLLSIPKIGMNDAAIVEGTAENQLQQGPGHYIGTALPGQAGNAAIAGHRTTYGAPFYDLNELVPGDMVTIQTTQGIFTYQVVTSHVVLPSNVTVLASSTLPELTLTTCNPRYSAAQRLVVVATLKTSITPASFPTTTAGTVPTTGSTPATSTPTSLAGEGGGLNGVSTHGEVAQALLWGLLTALAAILGLLGWRRGVRPWSWVVLAMGVPLTVAALLVCFQHISLALPQTF